MADCGTKLYSVSNYQTEDEELDLCQNGLSSGSRNTVYVEYSVLFDVIYPEYRNYEGKDMLSEQQPHNKVELPSHTSFV